jgi:hypothetical protein
MKYCWTLLGDGDVREVLAGDAILQAMSAEDSGYGLSLSWALTFLVAFEGDTSSLKWF